MLQELAADDNAVETGRIPRTVECELTDDMVDSCVPGDVVTVCGVVKVCLRFASRAQLIQVLSADVDAQGRSRNKNSSLFVMYIGQ